MAREAFQFLTFPFRSASLEGPPAPPNGRTVLALPGLIATERHVGILDAVLKHAGYEVLPWEFGRVRGVTDHTLDDIAASLDRPNVRKPVILVGWSLGGIFAREVAKKRPDLVSKVLTLGSPFSGDPRANNAWRLYRLSAGHAVDDLPIKVDLGRKPDVETVAFWSPRDGIVAPASARGLDNERDRAVELGCTHVGFVYDREALRAILAELDR